MLIVNHVGILFKFNKKELTDIIKKNQTNFHFANECREWPEEFELPEVFLYVHGTPRREKREIVLG
jgi:hypothetical protein